MADAPERLFRDDAGAALERAHRLEQENQALRAEIEDIKRTGASGVPTPYRVGTVALCVATIAVGATLTFSSPADQPDVPLPQGQLMPPGYTPPAYTAQPPQTSSTCTPPYSVDQRGNRVFKKECL